jgi:hypothetical protein
MTKQQRTELDKAIARAAARGIILVGRGYRRSDHAPVFATTSGAGPMAAGHLVAVVAGRLVCDCRSRVICAHRGRVHETLATERDAREAASWARYQDFGETQC